MHKIIAIANQKGGVGKTTTCVNLASYLALMGKRVLAVDIDPQGNCSSGFGIDKTKVKYSTYSVLSGEVDAKAAIIPTLVKNLDIMPSNIDLAGAEVELVGVEDREKVLKKVLSPLRNSYDYILIQGEYYALEGLSQLMNTIRLAKKILNPQLEVEGVVLTMYDSRSRLVQNVTEEIYKFFGKKVFDAKIPRNIRLGEAPSFGLPVMLFEPKCVGSLAYKALAEEFLARNNDTYKKITDLKILKYKAQ